MIENLLVNAEDTGNARSTSESGRCPGEGNGNLFQYSCLENPMDGGAWWAIVHGVSESETTECVCAHVRVHTHTHTHTHTWKTIHLLRNFK